MSQSTQLTSTDGTRFEAYIALASETPAPAIVVIPSIMGVTDGLKATADRFAGHGYIVVAIDPFARQLPGPLTSERRDEAQARMSAWKLEEGLQDVRATVAHLAFFPSWNGKWALMGYCFGGRLAFTALSQLGADAAVAYHGVGMEYHLEEAGAISAPFSFHFGEEDPVIPLATVAAISAALDGKDGAIHTYAGAAHGFAQQESARFHSEAGPLAEKRALTMLARLQSPPVSAN